MSSVPSGTVEDGMEGLFGLFQGSCGVRRRDAEMVVAGDLDCLFSRLQVEAAMQLVGGYNAACDVWRDSQSSMVWRCTDRLVVVATGACATRRAML